MGKNETEVALLPAHSTLGASSADRWMNCPGSVRLSVGIPSTTSEYAEEGTRAHEIAAMILNGEKIPKGVSEEMLEAVEVYTNHVQAAFEEFPDEDEVFLYVEEKFALAEVHPLLFGTADCAIYYPKRKLLRVKDYKHGAGYAVEVENNSQLKYYGLGALMKLGKPCEIVELEIVQPRAFHPDGPIRAWSLTSSELFEFIGELNDAALATENPNAVLSPGSHCKWCPAKALCPALASKANDLAKEEFREGLTYDPLKLAEVLAALPAIETYVKGVREFAYSEASRGRDIPGWKLVPTRATRKWVDEEKAKGLLQEVAPGAFSEAFEKPKFKSVAQMEKYLAKPVFQKMETVIVSVSSGSTLVPASDKRPTTRELASVIFDDGAANLLD